MRIGVFTALLSAHSLESALQKLSKLNVHTVELGTGNYPGDPHCKLSMLESENELKEFKKKLDRTGFHDQRAQLPRQSAASGRSNERNTTAK